MIPGEYFFDGESLELNAGRATSTLPVNNTGDRPIQVGSHFHFFEVNRALTFDRPSAYGMRLDLPAGTAVRFEPGEIKTVRLVALGGQRQVYGGSGLVMGALDDRAVRKRSLERLQRGTAFLASGGRKPPGSGKGKKPKQGKKTKGKRKKAK